MGRREKLFGTGRAIPLDREDKIRLMHRVRALVRAKGISAKTYVIFEVLLYGFHNAKSGRCFPSYERIAERAGCTRSTVALAIKTLELAGLLTWHNRIVRIGVQGLIRLVRTSNAYRFVLLVQKPPKSDNQTETPVKSHSLEGKNSLEAALQRLGSLVRGQTLTV